MPERGFCGWRQAVAGERKSIRPPGSVGGVVSFVRGVGERERISSGEKIGDGLVHHVVLAWRLQ